MMFFRQVRGDVVALCALCVLSIALPGCAAHRAREAAKQAKVTPAILYKRAKKDLDGNNFSGAIKTYEALTARFPFTDEARQARIDLIYAYYRANEGESATDAADTFIRENPTHPRVDYAYYIKGLVDFEHQPNALESLFHADMSKRPPTTARKAFAAFKIVFQSIPGWFDDKANRPGTCSSRGYAQRDGRLAGMGTLCQRAAMGHRPRGL